MKRTLLLVIWSILTISIYAQVPQGISHQATIRNSDNELITSSPIGLRVSILPGSIEGIPVYVETHHPTSNSNGLITYVLGSGTVVSGVFSDIDWTSGIYFLKTEVDPLGGTDYVISGATQFHTVPFAFHAETAESFTETDPVYSADPAFSITDAGSGAVITDAERTKLGGIADGAEVNVQSDWTEADNTNDAFIANKPTLFTTSDETDPVVGAVNGIVKADGAGTISAAVEGTDYSLLPDQTGNSGKYLSTDGSSASWQTAAGGGAAFAQFFALMPPDNAATVAPGTDDEFPQDGPTSATDITRTGAGSFNLAAIGTYAVNWQVPVTEAGQLLLTLNGADLAYTVVGRATGTNQIVGTSLITTTVINSILTVRNPAGNPVALTITPLAGGTRPVSASLVITQLQ